MRIPIYQVDTFTDQRFGGNPAAVCNLGKSWISENLMQKIAMENNLAETAFYILENNNINIRWFTPTVEVDLCGHATLATAHVLFEHEGLKSENVSFNSKSGHLLVSKIKGGLQLDFPTDIINKVQISDLLMSGFSAIPIEAFKGKTDYMLVFSTEDEIRNMKVDFDKVERIPCRGVIVTAIGNKVDFVSRFFAPQSGINEDPVTGSAHTTLIPYWHSKLGKDNFTAQQLSARVGNLNCEFKGERVLISGKATTFLKGEIEID